MAASAMSVVPVCARRRPQRRARIGSSDHSRKPSSAHDAEDQQKLFARGWTDGLAVVFPTDQKIAGMVETFGRNAEEVIA
jgi:hypothetical protein